MEFVKRNPQIFILSGKARSGKETVSEIIKNYYHDKDVVTISFASTLKEYAKKISRWNGSEEDKPRELLQQLGVELIKEKLDDKLLIKRVIEDIEVYSYFFDVIIITDARLIDEIELVKNKYPYAKVLRIIREDYENELTDSQRNHITETGLDEYHGFDYTVINKDLEQLKIEVNKILDEVNYE